ncbi:unnamed protein product [Soboliphyme baturini]|uniref:Separase n=1 Tax=Soboliphyme baturini TaxID=241478 RepID=A0A183IPR8_9BILA|nr:unnamed protein product [Soboliphyme baturini]
MPKIYHCMATLSCKLHDFHLALVLLSRAIVVNRSRPYFLNLWARFVSIRQLALAHGKTADEGCANFYETYFCGCGVDANVVLDSALLFCDQLRATESLSDLEFEKIITHAALCFASDPLVRARAFLNLAVQKYSDVDAVKSIALAVQYCAECIRLANSATDCARKHAILFSAYVWFHMCRMQKIRSAVNFTYKDLDSGISLNIAPRFLENSEEYAVLKAAWTVWEQHLIDNSFAMLNVDEQCSYVEYVRKLMVLMLLSGDNDRGIRLSFWIFKYSNRFADFGNLVLLCVQHGLSKLACALYEQCVSDLTTMNGFDEGYLQLLKLLAFSSTASVDKLATLLDKVTPYYYEVPASSGEFCRRQFMYYYALHLCLTRRRQEIPDNAVSLYASWTTPLYNAFRCSTAAVKRCVQSEDVFQDLSDIKPASGDALFDFYRYVWATLETGDAHHMVGLQHHAIAYYSEGCAIAIKLCYPYWALRCLNEITKLLTLSNSSVECSLMVLANFLLEYVASTLRKFFVSKHISITRNLFRFYVLDCKDMCRCAFCTHPLIQLELVELVSQLTLYFVTNDHGNFLEHFRVSLSEFNSTSSRLENRLKAQLNEEVSFAVGWEEVFLRKSSLVKCSILCEVFLQLLQKNMIMKDACAVDDTLKLYPLVKAFFSPFHTLRYNYFRAVIQAVVNGKSYNSLTALLSSLHMNPKATRATKCKTSRARVKSRANGDITTTKLNKLVTEIEADLASFSHLMFYPWYAEVNEFLAYANIKKDAWNVAYHLSEKWTVILLHLNSIILGQNLLLVRMSARASPYVQDLGPVLEEVSNFYKNNALLEFDEILKQSADSLKTSNREEFWRNRYALDKLLETFLNTLQVTWFKEEVAALCGFRQPCTTLRQLLDGRSKSLPSSVLEVIVKFVVEIRSNSSSSSNEM